MPEERTPGEIRREIELERERLTAAVEALGAEAKRTARLASYAAGALTGLLALRRLRRRRRRAA
jgi:Protein of unknown function (DUF3618)